MKRVLKVVNLCLFIGRYYFDTNAISIDDANSEVIYILCVAT